MNRSKSSQDIQITGSSGVSIGDISQTVHLSGEAQPREDQPVRVLFLAANPARTARLRLDQEVKAIEEALRSADSPNRFKLEQSWAVGFQDIQDSLLRYRPDIVHLSGHGSSTGRLALEEDSLTRDVSMERVRTTANSEAEIRALPRIFAAARGAIRCVVLNACHSGAAAPGIAEHVDCVIGMSNLVKDEAAIRFAWAFYHALVHGQSVKTAFDLARTQCDLAALEEDIPRLLATRCDPAGVLFVPSSDSWR